MALNSMGLGMTFRATDEASGVMRNVQNNLGKTAEASKAASLTMKDMGRGFEKVGTASTVAGGAIAAGLGLAVHQAAEFQFGVAQVVTEADAAKLPASEIARLAKEMAQTYGGSLDTQIKAAYQGVAAGADSAAKSMALLNGANRLAIAGATQQETALLGITKVLNNYNLSFDRSTDVADAFFVAVKGGQTTVGELGDAIGQVAALSKNAGLSMEEMIGALGTAATLGKDTAQSAAAMKAALSGIAHPTADAAAEAAKLGVKFDSVSLRSMGLVKFLEKITGSSKYTADSMNKLFGSVEGAAFMSALASNKMGALHDMMDGMSKKSGGAEEAFKTMSATLKQVGSILTANVQVAMVEIGTSFLPMVTGATKFGTAIVKAFLALPDPVKKALASLAAVSSIVLLVAGGIASLAAVLLTTELPLIALAAALGAVIQLMLPLIVIGGALVGVAYAFKRAWETDVGFIRTTLIPAFDKVRLVWDALSQAFSQGGFSGKVRDELAKAENSGIKNFAISVFSWFARIQNFVAGVGKGFGSALDAAGPTFARLAIAVEKVGGAFMKLFGGKADPQKAAQTFDRFGSAGERVGAIIEGVAEIIATGLSTALEWSAAFMGTLAEWRPSFERAWGAVMQLWTALGPLLTSLGMLAAAFGLSGQSAGGHASALATLIGLFANFIAIAAPVVGFIAGTMAMSFQALAVVVDVVGSAIKAYFKSLIDGFAQAIPLAAKLIDAIGAVMGKKNASGALLDSFKGMVGQTPGAPGAAAAGAAGAAATGGKPIQLSPITPAPVSIPTSTPLGASSPATADVKGAAAGGTKNGSNATEIGMAVGAAIKAAPPPNVTLNAPILLDSEKIGEAMAGKGGTANARSFTPGPKPTG